MGIGGGGGSGGGRKRIRAGETEDEKEEHGAKRIREQGGRVDEEEMKEEGERGK